MFNAYLELTKPRITLMVLVTTAMGFFLGGKGIHSVWPFLITLAGTALASSGGNALNEYLERDADGKMERTKNRPLPTGRIRPSQALAFGISLTLAGVFLLALAINLLTGFLVLLAAFLYVLVYTPMKKLSWLNTLIGAIPGAIPPLAGWTAARGELQVGGWILFWILFLWQHPHFFAIAWMYREDYQRGGFKMLPVVEPDGKRTFRQILWHSAVLVPISLAPFWIGMSGLIYFWGALILGLGFLAVGILFSRTRTIPDARKLLRASIIYLPVLLLMILIDSGYCWNGVSKKALPVFDPISPFALQDSRHQVFTRENLKGKIWIANFMFTTCAGPCPLMTKGMASLYRSFLLEDKVHFVSVSVNPSYDSPKVLSDYARRYQANPDRWHFVTGSSEAIKKLAVEDFKIGSIEDPVFHSTHFVLLDGSARIRGYYDSTQKGTLKKLFQDTARLLKEK